MRPIVKRVSLALAVVAFLIGAAYVVQAHGRYSKFNEKLMSLGEITIGDSREEVFYRHGQPTDVGSNDTALVSVNELSNPSAIKDYEYWLLKDSHGPNTGVTFDPKANAVVKVSCVQLTPDGYDRACETVGSISTVASQFRYNLEDSVTGRFGAPDSVEYKGSAAIRIKIISYRAMGLKFWFLDNEVFSIEKDQTRPSFLWWLFNGQFDAV